MTAAETPLSLREVASDLRHRLAQSANHDLNDDASLHQQLRDEFHEFGVAARLAGADLEESMAIAVAILQETLDDSPAFPHVVPTTIVAGSVFAAVAHGFQFGRVQGEAPVSNGSLDSRLAQLTALHQIGRAATGSSSPGDLLDLAVRAIGSATESDAAAVFLFDPASERLALWAATGLNPASIGALAIPLSEGLTGLAASERRPVVVEDAQRHPAWVTSHNFGDTVYASQASIPMILESQDKLVGVLNVLTVNRRSFSSEEIDFLQTAANELAISVEFARLHDQTDERLRQKIAELGTLQRVSRSVASSLAVSDVLRLVAASATEICQAEATALFRLHRRETGGQIEERPIVEHRIGQARQATDVVIRDDFVRSVIESGSASTMNLDYVDGSSRLYCIPLRSAREIWGALCVRLPSGNTLSEDQLGLLQSFTDSASIAIENAELFEHAQANAAISATLLQEMHHRVRNNLQTVAALLSLQMRQVDDEETSRHLMEAAGRVQSIAAVHDLLSDESRLSGASIADVANLVVDETRNTVHKPGLAVTFDVVPNDLVVPSRHATILALLINELISNAISHGFRDREKGSITIAATREGSNICLVVENDGEQVPTGFNPSMSSGLGLRIVERLAQFDLGGTFKVIATGSGTRAEIRFPSTAIAEIEAGT